MSGRCEMASLPREAGQEQVEPQGGRDRGHKPGNTVTGDGDRHYHGDKGKSGGRALQIFGPKKEQDGGHPEREDKRRGEGDDISVRPETFHANPFGQLPVSGHGPPGPVIFAQTLLTVCDRRALLARRLYA